MRYFVTSSKDASIYTDYQNQNTGIDQILDLFKYKTSEVDKSSRVLIEFDFTDVSDSIVAGTITNPTFSLHLTTTTLRELAYDFDLKLHPLSGSWEMGLGKRQDSPKTTTGVSYTYKDQLNGTAWSGSGADYYTTPSSSLNFGQSTTNAVFDITEIVNSYLTGSIPNNGFIVKFTDAEENDSNNYGEINFFSSETNTIYRPRVVVEWDDSSVVTGSLSQTNDDDVFVTIKNLKKEYKVDTQYKFRLHSRNQFPTLTYGTGSVYSQTSYLPTGSMYSIIDNVTKDVIVPFGSTTKISVDSNGNYFNQNFKGWEAERYYTILFKVDDGTGNYQLVDKNFTFKLVE